MREPERPDDEAPPAPTDRAEEAPDPRLRRLLAAQAAQARRLEACELEMAVVLRQMRRAAERAVRAAFPALGRGAAGADPARDQDDELEDDAATN